MRRESDISALHLHMQTTGVCSTAGMMAIVNADYFFALFCEKGSNTHTDDTATDHNNFRF
jgi:hypothetical protein